MERTSKHVITRTRLDLGWRTLTVASRRLITPHRMRIEFSCPDLANFQSPSPDDHVKLLFHTAEGEKAMRDFTPRAWSEKEGTFSVEFALHADGPAVTWARNAIVGDELQCGGPRGSIVMPDDFDWYLLIGDATALPSILRRLEGLRAGVPVSALLLVEDETEIQVIETKSRCHTQWFFKDGGQAYDTGPILQALSDLTFPAGDGFIWIAGEGALTRRFYQWAREEKGHPEEWIKAAEYWKGI